MRDKEFDDCVKRYTVSHCVVTRGHTTAVHSKSQQRPLGGRTSIGAQMSSIWKAVKSVFLHPPPPPPPPPPDPPSPPPPPLPPEPPCADLCRHTFHQACCKRHCAHRPPPAPDQTSAAPPKPQRVQPSLTVALLLTGLVDSPSHGGGLVPQAVDAWKEFVIDVFTRSKKHTVHTFICAEPQTQWRLSKNGDKTPGYGEQPKWSKLQTAASPLIPLGGNRSALLAIAREQYSRMEACYREARKYERRLSSHRAPPASLSSSSSAASSAASLRSSNDAAGSHGGGFRRHFAFTHFVRARPDLIFYAPIPLSAFERDAVSARARAIMFADECEQIHRHALAHPGDGGIMPDDQSRRNPCDVGRIWSKKQGTDPTAQRDMMRAAGLRTCAAVDDMFAIVPAHLGDAFFLTPATLALRPMGGPTHGYRGWNMTRSAHSVAAVRRTYGPQLNPFVYFHTCGGGSRVNYMGG